MKNKFSLLFLFFILNFTLLGQDLKIISSSTSSIVFEYSPIYSDTVYRIINGEKYIDLTVAGTRVENFIQAGKTRIISKVINVGVPAEFGNTIQIISAEYTTFQFKPVPNPAIKKDSTSGWGHYFISPEESDLPSEPVNFGEFGYARNLPVQTIKVFPVTVDANGFTKALRKIVFALNFGQLAGDRETINDDFLEYSVVNWEVARKWGVKQATRLAKSSSALAAGQWYRFETPEEGVYKIDKAFLQSLGINLSSVDPRTIKIFGNGGYSLPENYDEPRPAGFKEIAISVIGEQDGKFDDADYILFYGRGPEFWEYNKKAKKIVRVKHPFTKKNYYWLTYDGAQGKRISAKQSLDVPSAYQQPYALSYRSLDKDSLNIGKSGREYFGDLLDKSLSSRNYITTLNGILPNSKINYRFRLANTSEPEVLLRVFESNNQVYLKQMEGSRLDNYEFGRALLDQASFSGSLSQERSNLKFSISTSAASAKVYLDYFEIEYRRLLNAAGDNLLFFSKDTSATIQYTVSGFTNGSIQVFDVTDYSDVKLISGAEVSGGQVRFQAAETQNGAAKYLALTPVAYKTPANGASVQNSNIRGTLGGSELIVITNKVFKAQAEKYAAYRSGQSPSKLSTSIFYVDEIFNEFSNGMMDPTAIRDFLKFAYDNWQVKPFYVLLLGDGDFDYLNSIKEESDKNFVPTYQTQESLYEIYSYPSDDFYARVSGKDVKIDLAIGRLTAQSTAEAEIMIDKIIKYETGMDKGPWRTNITLVADDGPTSKGDDGSLHTAQSERLANKFIPKYFDQNKLYLVAYPTQITGLGRRKPDVNRLIVDAVNNGTLIINFIGHGNPNVWTHENVFEKASTIPQLKNSNYFFVTAATCDFGKYDDPTEQSSTELMLALKNSGTIGTFTAARVVYSLANAVLNDSFYTYLFRAKNKDNGKPIRIGRAYFLAKQYLNSENDEKFHLFCDPTIRLAEPYTPISIDSVNNKDLSGTVNINALGEVLIKGSVRNNDGTPANQSGEAIVSVFDSERSLYFKEMNYSVIMPGGLIYRGKTTVNNGKFETGFVVPKDISYENKNGRITTYFYNDSEDGIGYTGNIVVGGTNPNAVNDGKGPQIEIFFDDENFEGSYLVNQDFTLIVKLSDQTGLNTTGTGIGHRLEAVVNDNENEAIDLTNYFVGDLNSFGKSGVIRYKFTGLEAGEYKIKIKAWDVFNNFGSQEAYFTVISADEGITVRNVVNYPNPFASNTTFTFQHNISGPINVKVKVYTIAGRMIKEIEENGIIDKFVKIDWDGRDADGNQLANGTYLYKIIVESADSKYKDNVLGKISVIR